MTTTSRHPQDPAAHDPSAHDAAQTEPSTTARGVTGALRLAAAIAMATAIAHQIGDQVANGVFEPPQYFSFFTVQTGFINVAVLVGGAVLALRSRRDSHLSTAVRLCAVTYAAVTGVVYNLLLRDIPAEGDFVAVAWPGEVEHVWIPLFMVADWLFAPGRPRLGWGRIWLALAYPLLWVASTLVRGAADGWYPYPFLEPDGPAGDVGVAAYVAGISVFVVGVASLAIALSRRVRS